MITVMTDVVLLCNENYMIMSPNDVQPLDKNTHINRQVYLTYTIDTPSSCEYESYWKNITLILSLCNFRKVCSMNGVYLTDTLDSRLLYVESKNPSELNSPSEKGREKLIG